MTDPIAAVSASESPPAGAPRWLRAWAAINEYLSTEMGGGPRVLKLSWVINFQKGGTFLFVLALMWLYHNWSTAAWVYLALHGSYGLCWLLKDVAFPDPRWQVRVTFGGALMSFALVLALYWSFPFILISRHPPDPSGAWLAMCISLHTLGVVIMMTSDAQKHFTLQARRGLITDGLFRFIRHPNYLGEMMLYLSYALLVRHWFPFVVLAWVWGNVFASGILSKEASLARHPGWAAYRARSGYLLPWL